MTKVQKIVGIDISKDFFDTAQSTQKGYQTKHFDYNKSQMQLFIDSLDNDTLCVMESTGVYHLRLAYELFGLDPDAPRVFCLDPALTYCSCAGRRPEPPSHFLLLRTLGVF